MSVYKEMESIFSNVVLSRLPVALYHIVLIVLVGYSLLKTFPLITRRKISIETVWNSFLGWSKLKFGFGNMLINLINYDRKITDAEKELDLAKMTLKETQRIGRIAPWSHDCLTGEMQWSPEMFKMLGLPKKSVTAEWMLGLLHPDDVEKAIVDSTCDDGVNEIELRTKNSDDKYMYFYSRWESHFDGSGKELSRVGTVQDITKRKQAEGHNFLLKQAIGQADEVFISTDSDGYCLCINPAFEKIMGWKSENIIGKNMEHVFGPHHPKKYSKHIRSTLVSGEKWTGRLITKDKNEVARTFEAVISPVFDKGKRILEYFCILRDVTKELHDQACLRQSQKMESIGRLAGGVAHDFNNMLTIIMGRAEILKSDLVDDASSCYEIDEILQAANNSKEITRQLLAFARKDTVKPQYLSLNEEVNKNLGVLRRLIGENLNLAGNLEATTRKY